MNKAARHSLFLAGIFAAFVATESQAGPPNPTASDARFNTAGGTSALVNETSGSTNTAFGYKALTTLVSGSTNDAFGYETLIANTTGTSNAAFGAASLLSNTTGFSNVAVGNLALRDNTSGSENVAVGPNALFYNVTGQRNTAVGYTAMSGNSSDQGNDNTAVGWESLSILTSGIENTASGSKALFFNQTGNSNTAVGYNSLSSNSTGSGNIALGNGAGSSTNGSNNIDIGNAGVASETGVIRVGTSGTQTTTFVAGISGVTLTGGGSTVLINANGQLGTVASSARYKQDIADMGDSSARLALLRPVTFHYKADTSQQQQYGLIAEEVAQVYPDLVVRNQQGQVESVQYHELIPMLLNEVQKQQHAHQQDVAQIAELRKELEKQAMALNHLQASLEQSSKIASR